MRGRKQESLGKRLDNKEHLDRKLELLGRPGVRSVDLVSEVVRPRLRLVLVSRHRLLRLLDKLKLLHHSAVVVSAQQRHLVALDRLQEHPRSVAVAVAVREAVYLVNRLQHKAAVLLVVRAQQAAASAAEVLLAAVNNKLGVPHLEVVEVLHREPRLLELLRNRAVCLGINRNKIKPLHLANHHKHPGLAVNNNNLEGYSVLNLPLHLPEDPLEVHRNSQVVGVDYLGPRERRQEVPAVLALLLHQLQVSVGSALHKDNNKDNNNNNNNNNKMLLVSHNLLGEAICLERSKTKAVAGSLIKAVNNLDLGPRRKRRRASALPSSNKDQLAGYSALSLHNREESLEGVHQRRRVLSLEVERKLRRRAVKPVSGPRHQREPAASLAQNLQVLLEVSLVVVHSNRARVVPDWVALRRAA